MSRAKFLVRTVSVAAIVSLTACTSTPTSGEETVETDPYKLAMAAASRPASAEEIAIAQRSDPLTRANFWAEEYRKDAANLDVIVQFMKALRGIGSHERVEEIASTTLPIHPTSHEIFLELGRSLMAREKPLDAAQIFARSADLAPDTEAAPLAALGVALDQIEEHAKAQAAYKYALERQPTRVSTLSNYGLSLALTGDLEGAEVQLRKAVALPGSDVRVRQNLALILGLQGRYDEMSAVDPDAPRRTIEANRQALRTMMIPARTYRELTEAPLDLPAPVIEVMPDVREAEVAAENMPALTVQETQTAETETDAETLSGAGDTPAPMRPRLRGSQGG